MPWRRPAPHPEFSSVSSALRDEIRFAVVDQGGPCSQVFRGREVWSGSFERAGSPRGIHKKTLIGRSIELTKCVWCECRRYARREVDVEHFRPKCVVTEWRGNPHWVSDTPPKEHEIQAGYWWRAVDWTNFALSCKICNSDWKRNLFPVAGNRAACAEDADEHEQPMLLEPGADFLVSDHFRWLADGTVVPLSDRAAATVIACGLNRTPLVDLRGKKAAECERVFGRLRAALRFRREPDQARAMQEIAFLGRRDEEFTSMVRWMAEQLFRVPWGRIQGMPQ